MIVEAIRILSVTLIAFLVAITATPILIGALKRLNLGKQIRTSESAPIFSKLHEKKEGTPTMGGIVIWGTVLFLVIVFWILDLAFDGSIGHLNFLNRAETYLPLAALVIASLLGLFDDVLGVLKIGSKGGGLTVKGKLGIYFLISGIGAWWFYSILDWHEIIIPFYKTIDIGIWYVPIFMFIIVASAFSSDLTDGLDGLLGGVALFSFGTLSIIAFSLGRYDLSAMGGAILGALLAFLWFNIYPAKFFMGDTGSMSLGITLGVIAMLTNTVFLFPFFVIIFIIESSSVIVQVLSKKYRGKKIFLSTPIHHHFEAIGWPESQVTMRFWIISIVFSSMGLAIFFIDKFI